MLIHVHVFSWYYKLFKAEMINSWNWSKLSIQVTITNVKDSWNINIWVLLFNFFPYKVIYSWTAFLNNNCEKFDCLLMWAVSFLIGFIKARLRNDMVTWPSWRETLWQPTCHCLQTRRLSLNYNHVLRNVFEK